MYMQQQAASPSWEKRSVNQCNRSNRTHVRRKGLQEHVDRNTALISEWMVREGFLKGASAEQAALGQSECPHLHFTACDETSVKPPNQASAGLHHTVSFMGGERPAAFCVIMAATLKLWTVRYTTSRHQNPFGR